MVMGNKVFKWNNADQVKGNAIHGSSTFIQKVLKQNQIIHKYSEQRKITFAVINNFSSIKK